MIQHSMLTPFVFYGVTREEVETFPVSGEMHVLSDGTIVLGSHEDVPSLAAKKVPPLAGGEKLTSVESEYQQGV